MLLLFLVYSVYLTPSEGVVKISGGEINQLQAIASNLLSDGVNQRVIEALNRSGYSMQVRLSEGEGSFASVSCGSEFGVIYVCSNMSYTANSWAFIIGHEIAHCIDDNIPEYNVTPQTELRADILGAILAINAGYCLDAYQEERSFLVHEDYCSTSHGCFSKRFDAVIEHFKGKNTCP